MYLVYSGNSLFLFPRAELQATQHARQAFTRDLVICTLNSGPLASAASLYYQVISPAHFQARPDTCWQVKEEWGEHIRFTSLLTVILYFLDLFYAYKCFACMYVCWKHVYLVFPEVRLRLQISWNWSYKMIVNCMEILSIKPKSSARTSALGHLSSADF